MARTSPRSDRGASSRRRLVTRILIVALLALAALLVLNTVALNNETEPAGLTTEGARLVNTTSGQIQVLDSAPAEGSVVDVGGVPTTVADVPAATVPGAPPVVLIHGSGGAINWWDELTPLLTAQGRQVIAVDMLGYGGSEKPSSGYEIETQANLLAQVLSRLGVERAAVVGHSLGGKVATALAESSPDLVAGVVVIDTPPDSSYGSLGGGAKLARMPVIGQALWRLSPDFLVRRNLEQAFAPGFDFPDVFVDDIRAMTYPAYRDSARESDTYTDEQPLDVRLEAVGLPLLVIFGDQDQLYPARESLSAYAAIPGAKTVLIPEAGHSPNVETPKRTALEIGNFVNTLAPPRTGPRPELSGSGPGNRKGDRSDSRRGRQNGQNAQNQRGQGNREGQGNQGQNQRGQQDRPDAQNRQQNRQNGGAQPGE
jgi:pimeloyl-ACP methyl ester carboxylesterase